MLIIAVTTMFNLAVILYVCGSLLSLALLLGFWVLTRVPFFPEKFQSFSTSFKFVTCIHAAGLIALAYVTKSGVILLAGSLSQVILLQSLKYDRKQHS